MADNHDTHAAPEKSGFVRRAALVYALGAVFLTLVCLLWLAGNVLLLGFAAILLAVLLGEASLRLRRWLPLARGPSIALVLAGVLVVLGLAGWLVAPGVAVQMDLLFDTLVRSLERVRTSLERHVFPDSLWSNLPSPESVASQATAMVTRAGLFFSGVLGAVTGAAVVVFVGIYLALRPDLYINGVVTLFPPAKRPRAREVLHEIGHMLAQWLMGKLLTMVIIGLLTALGLAALQVPLALVLGILAGLLDFIPYIGPIMAGVPAVLIAFAESPLLAFYVLLLFIGLQAAEGYLLLPFIERRTVSMPPALTIMMQVLLGTFFGLAGVALATPLTAVFAVLITMLYVQDVLGDQVKVPGEH